MKYPGSTACAVACAIAALGTGASAAAVTLNPRGLGQVLIYPYYTANAGFGTLLTVVNTTPRGKALKVRFHEGYNGRIVSAFNLYLSPLDAWVGQVFDTGTSGDSGAALASSDNSCVVPGFLVPVDPGSGLPRTNFGTDSFSGANADGGPTSAARTREGYFDVIEMGEVTNATHSSLTAITHVDGVPENCVQVQQAWTSPGYWTQDPTIDLAPPTGGLYGAESVINVAAGLMYTINATAIDGFSSIAQHNAPNASAPDLDTASANAGNAFAAFVPLGAKLVELDFERAEDAVSALFMVDNLYNEYVADADIGARSDWIVTLPTKRFYTDPALLGAGASARPPFDALFGGAAAAASCSPIGVQFWNREEQTTYPCGWSFCSPDPTYALCYAANSLPVGSAQSALGSQLLSATGNHKAYVDLAPVGFKSGWLRLDLRNDSTGSPQMNHQFVATNGSTLLGLPALGFLALDYVNSNVTPGVLANYSGAHPHRASGTCFKTADPLAPC